MVYLIKNDSEVFINDYLVRNGYAYKWSYGKDIKIQRAIFLKQKKMLNKTSWVFRGRDLSS